MAHVSEENTRTVSPKNFLWRVVRSPALSVVCLGKTARLLSGTIWSSQRCVLGRVRSATRLQNRLTEESFMPDAYVIEVSGQTAGIVARDPQSQNFNFFSAAPPFNALEGQRFSDPLSAERAARLLAKTGSLPRRLIPADLASSGNRGRFG
jgi:hypothetical protein